MDTLKLINTFREVAARGGFSRAAIALEVSKANVSKYVAELERQLGTRLLNRSTRTISLTDAGSLLLERSTPLLEMMALTRDELLHRSREPSGRLRMTAPYGIGSVELSGLLSDFMRRYPEVQVSLDLSNSVRDMVEEGMDLALRIGATPDPNLIVRRLRPIHMVICAAPGYWEQRGRPGHPDELAKHDALTLSLSGMQPAWSFKVEGKPHSVALRSRMDATDSGTLVQMALQGMGVAQLPCLLVKKLLADGSLQDVLPEFSPEPRWLYAAYAQRRQNSAALKALLAFLEKRWKVD
ncbi:Transcriptional regulator, LysR family [Polaromonas sp. CG9_12]|uniref:LysR family transcriptional regulator n=1 Tax=Polaromonas sp. CG_9.11 TaxID=2787730 RepID=UPI0004DDC970|nr:LysR family transcriptional regulator [Polaromonas sp. CG_9.11]MBG6075673.1 DNA-binding transcriptional LysR family regulator [Polaromonas sp. CG_9.11]CDS52518.1 Transcriptional regulator, LysR family [Polaromonas sp. CG9_12]